MELGLNLKKMWDEFSLKATISKTILITKIYNKCSDQQWSISNSDWNARYRSL